MKTKDSIKTIFIGAGVLLLASTASARERLLLEQDDLSTPATEKKIETGRRYGYDNVHQYTGIMKKDGYTVLTNKYTGKTVSGYVDAGGYGDLRDENGYRIIKVRPK